MSKKIDERIPRELGEGVLPMPELMKEIQDYYHYERTATIELVTGYINEPRLYAKRAITNVRAMLEA